MSSKISWPKSLIGFLLVHGLFLLSFRLSPQSMLDLPWMVVVDDLLDPSYTPDQLSRTVPVQLPTLDSFPSDQATERAFNPLRVTDRRNSIDSPRLFSTRDSVTIRRPLAATIAPYHIYAPQAADKPDYTAQQQAQRLTAADTIPEVPSSSKVGDLLIGLLTQALFFTVGWFFFQFKLAQDSEREHVGHIQVIFSVAFSLSSALFVLLLFELADIMDRSSRLSMWRVNLCGLLALIVCGIPLVLGFSTLRKYIRSPIQRILLVSFAYLVFFYLFIIARANVTHAGHPSSYFSSIFSLAHIISRVGAVGVTSVAILSGFGAVNCPQQFLGDCFTHVDDTSLLVAHRHAALSLDRLGVMRGKYIANNVVQRQLTPEDRGAIQRCCAAGAAGGPTHPSTSATSTASAAMSSQRPSPFAPTLYASERVQVRSAGPNGACLLSFPSAARHCRREVDSADRLTWELNLVTEHSERYQRSQTHWGRVLNACGYFMSVFCLGKVVMCTVNVLRGKVTQVDPVTRVLHILVSHVADVRVNVNYWAQHISVILVGTLVATQMRGFLIFCAKAFRFGSKVLTTGAVLLLLTEMMSIYFVSMVLLVRLNMPAQYRRVITVVLGDVQFAFYHNWFDALFALSALVTCGIFVIQHRIKMAQVKSIAQYAADYE